MSIHEYCNADTITKARNWLIKKLAGNDSIAINLSMSPMTGSGSAISSDDFIGGGLYMDSCDLTDVKLKSSIGEMR